MKWTLISIITLAFGCSKTPNQKKDVEESSTLVYAEKFEILENEVIVNEPWPGAERPKRYTTKMAPKKVICTSTTHLPFIEMLGKENTLIGFPGTQYISSQKIRKLVENEEIIDVGRDGSLNLEIILGLKPDLVFAFDMGNESSSLDKLKESGIQVVYNADYLETSALGRAEWIKFFGSFYNEDQRADSIFRKIESNYIHLKKLTENVEARPTILSGVVYGDTWFLPGGKNWSAQFFNDAGGEYFLHDNNKTGWLELSFEYVFEKAHHSDYWIGVASFNTKQELQNQDNRYGQFQAFQNDRVYNYNKQVASSGGYDIFESGYARPDKVLKDLIYILHPEIIPDHKSYYFQRLP